MTALVLVLAVLAVAWWVCLSPARLATAGAVFMLAFPAPPLAVTVLATIGATAAAVALVHRVVSAEGWHLVTIARPNLAPVGGVAS